ncbi:MAG: hypothetical protein NTW16_16250 [Bacteroidetes bacterium]|nr:hypothetical protein [Bacteroidota bacterium]
MKKFLYWSVAILVVVLCLFIYWKYSFTYSEGNRSGLLQKFSYKGTIFKTYEGELILSSVKSNQDVSLASEKFFFSVPGKELAEKLLKLEGTMVVLHYKAKNGVLPWRGETVYLVDSLTMPPK